MAKATRPQPNWTSLTVPKGIHAKFQGKAKATGFSIVRLLDVSADLLEKLTPSQIADLVAAQNVAAAKSARKANA